MAAVSDVIVVEHGELRWGDRRAPLAAVRGLREVYSAWTGRAFLCVDGPQWKVPIGEGYAAARESLRRALPDVPMTGDWMDGRFPGAPFGLPPALVLTAAVGLAAGLAGAAAWVGGWPWGLAVAGLAAWPLGRLRDGWVVHVEGLRGGPPWGALAPWTLIEEVVVEVGPTASRVFTRGPAGGQVARLPTVLLPAFRARVRRLGGLAVREGRPGLDDQYARWSAPAAGIPWGVAVGVCAGAAWVPDPWPVLATGAWVTGGTALLGAIVLARHGGWRFGAVLASVLLYGFVLAAAASQGTSSGCSMQAAALSRNSSMPTAPPSR